MRQSAAHRKRSWQVKGNGNCHMGKDQSWGHRIYSFSIKSKFCLSLRLGSWFCNPAVHGQLTQLPPSSPTAGDSSVAVESCGSTGNGGGWVDAVFVSLSISTPVSLLQSRPCTICGPQWVFYLPAGCLNLPQDKARHADKHSTKAPLCCTAPSC